MTILAIDTSSRSESVALVRGGEVLNELQNIHKYKPSTEIFPLIQKVLAGAITALSEIQTIAVSIGPGSFTGLRVGLSLSKGLAISLDKPIVSVSSLEALVRASGVQGLVAPLMDARRGEVYGSLFEVTGQDIKQNCDEYAVDISDFCDLVTQKTIFIGEGANVFSVAIKGILGDQAEFATKEPACTMAGAVGLIGHKKLERGWCEDINRLTPRYIRKSEAEILRLKKAGIGAVF